MSYEVKIIKDILYRDGGKSEGPDSQTLDLYLPQGAENCPLLFFIHGGGFCHYNFTKDSYSSYCLHLAEEGIAVAAANYRLLPEFKGIPKEACPDYCPEGREIFDGIIDDTVLALRYVLDRRSEYALSGKVFLGGHSAGAYMAMLLLFDERCFARYGLDPKDLSGAILASGQPTSHFIRLYIRGLDPRFTLIDEDSPMYYLKSLPVPQLVTLAENDMENRALQTELYLASLKTIGYEGEVIFKVYADRSHNNYIIPNAKAPEEPCTLHNDSVAFIRKYSEN